MLRPSRVAFLSIAGLLALTAASRADFNFTVTLNVASLVSNINGPFSLDLALTQGGSQVNTVTISAFQFGGTGGFTNTMQTVPGSGVTGSFTSGPIVLTNSGLDNEVYQTFAAGVTSITFNVDETNHAQLAGSPDAFTVSILDGSLANIPTTDTNSNDIAAGTYALVSSSSAVQSTTQLGVFQSTASGEAPGVTASAVPEPASALMLLCGAVGLMARRRTFRRA
jgi:hypothetical protein